MPDRYWNGPLAFVAFGIVLLAAWSWIIWHAASERQHYTTAAQNYSERAEQDARAELDDCFTLSSGRYECAERIISAQRENQSSEYDLAAQQEMAYWTPWIALSSIITALAAVIGLGALAYQNNLSREATFQAQRAWLRLNAILLSGIYRDSNDQFRVDIGVDIENLGIAPANNVVVSVHAYNEFPVVVRKNRVPKLEVEAIKQCQNSLLAQTIFKGEDNAFRQQHIISISPPESDFLPEYPAENCPLIVAIVAVVAYQTPGDSRVSKSTRVFEIFKKTDVGILGIFIHDIPISRDKLVFRPSYVTGQAK